MLNLKNILLQKSFVFAFIFTICLMYKSFSFAKIHGEILYPNSHTWEIIADGIDYLYIDETLFFDAKMCTFILPTLEASTLDKTLFSEAHFQVHFVRIDPEKHNIDLFGNFLEEEKKNFSLSEWAQKKELCLAINASMYLPDRQTSTGYMTAGDLVNNSHIGSNMGGFLLSKPKEKSLLNTRLLEKSEKEWRSILEKYEVAIQNFRILGDYTDEKRKAVNMWKKSTDRHVIAAYGIDIENNIYFIFSQNPSSIYEFGQYLLSFSQDSLFQQEIKKREQIVFKTVLYAEGGSEAALYINTEKKNLYCSAFGTYSFLNFIFPIPNIIGIRK